jgi:hypothetical protein
MKVRMKNCKHCQKQYGATNSNQSYCCDVCRQQAYYQRHGIERYRNYTNGVKIGNVNPTFTEIVPLSDKNDVNETKEITPAVVTPVTPLIQHTPKNTTHDNFGAVLEQMNKTHQAQMEAMETRLKLSFAQQLHEQELNARADVISRLQKELKDKENQSDINTSQVLGGLTTMLSGIDVSDLIKAKA